MCPSEPHPEAVVLAAPPPRLPGLRAGMLTAVVLGVLAVGAAAGASGMRLAQRWQPRPVMLLQVAPIDKMQPDNPVAIEGKVAEIFGSQFIIQDQSGRALVELGPRGEGNEVAQGETVKVQGRFDRGVIHAQLLVHRDGRTDAFGPPPPPERGPRGLPGPGDRGEGPQPPPPPAAQ
jgi:uncharacterized protein YdeI (BOF family)